MWLKDNHIKVVLFDVDGTLLDTGEGIMHSMQYTLDKFGLPKLSNEILRKFVGPPPQEALQKYVGLSNEDAIYIANEYRNFYKNNALYEASLYDGIIPLLERLKRNGIKIAVATYKREDYALDILRYFGIADYCDVIHGADANNKMTKADIITLCCRELRVQKAKVLYVGDTEYDAKGAAISGVKFCAATWGYGFKKEKVVSEFLINLVCHQPNEIDTV